MQCCGSGEVRGDTKRKKCMFEGYVLLIGYLGVWVLLDCIILSGCWDKRSEESSLINNEEHPHTYYLKGVGGWEIK